MVGIIIIDELPGQDDILIFSVFFLIEIDFLEFGKKGFSANAILLLEIVP